MLDPDPLSILLVKRGGSGDRILFRYPYSEPPKTRDDDRVSRSRNLYAIKKNAEARPHADSNNARINEKNLSSMPSKILSNLCAVGPQCCDAKFEMKVDDVRFIGHPMSLEITQEEADLCYRYFSGLHQATMTMFHVVFVLSANTSHAYVKCFHDLSKMLGIAIKAEDRRTGYLEDEAKLMMNAQDEVASSDEKVSAFALALEVSELARTLKKVFEDVSHSGLVDIRVNSWTEVLFCLPQKVHKKINPVPLSNPDSIVKCMKELRPYHALLLLQPEKELLEDLPLDHNTAYRKVIEQSTPLKNFRVLVQDTGITKRFVFEIATQLVYWGKATVIYPVCNTNLYVVSPHVSGRVSPVLLDKFSEDFPGGHFLPEYLQLFSYPNSITQALPNVSRQDEYQLLARVIVWCLQHFLFIQVHTYVNLTLNDDCSEVKLPDPFNEGDDGDEIDDEGIEDDYRVVNIVPNRVPYDPATFVWPPLTTIRETDGFARKGHEDVPIQDLLKQMFSDEEISILRSIPASRNEDDLRMFVRVAPYFNGLYHIEEIMYQENLHRSQLLQLIDKFRDVLTKHEHEDSNLNIYNKAK